jgi:ribosome-binding protein aMBF1 (putative translation factor)
MPARRKARPRPSPDLALARRHEAVVIEIKSALARSLRRSRRGAKLSQGRLAERLGSSQSRVSKIEAGDPEVSLDLFVRALLAAGATRGDIGRAIGQASASPTPR